jgi:hypothetical protein
MYNSAVTGWTFKNGISLYAHQIKADSVIGDECLFDGIQYNWIDQLDCGFNLGTQATLTNVSGTSEFAHIGKAQLLGGNAYRASGKAGLAPGVS